MGKIIHMFQTTNQSFYGATPGCKDRKIKYMNNIPKDTENNFIPSGDLT